MQYTYIKKLSAGALLLFLLSAASPGLALEDQGIHNTQARPAPVPHPDTPLEDTEYTLQHWKLARKYQKAMRLELARQEYLLALATCRTDQSRDRLQRELQVVEMQIRTLR